MATTECMVIIHNIIERFLKVELEAFLSEFIGSVLYFKKVYETSVTRRQIMKLCEHGIKWNLKSDKQGRRESI